MFYRTTFQVCLLVLLLSVVSCKTQAPATAEPKPEAKQAEPAVETAAKTVAKQAAEEKQAVPDPCEDFLVGVGDAKITLEQIKYLLPPGANNDMICGFAKHWIDGRLLYEEALRRGIGDTEKVKIRVADAIKEIHVRAMLDQIKEDVNVTEQDMLDFYEKHKDSDKTLRTPHRLTFSHVKVKTLKQAQAVRERLDNGADINALARELSADQDADRGGKVSRMMENSVKNKFGKEFAKALREASNGDIVGPIKGKKGFYEVAQLHSQEPARPKPFETLKDKIRMRVKRRTQNKIIENLVTSLRKQSKDRIFKSSMILEYEKKKEEKRK